MFIPTADQALDRLGDKVVTGMASAVAAGRADLTRLRQLAPDIIADLDERSLANLAHSLIWKHVKRQFDDVDGVHLRDCEPFHEIHLDWACLRVKRHNHKGHTRSYPTQGALEFYAQVAEVDLLGERKINLIAGYIWETDTRTIGDAVLSMTYGTAQDLEWMVTLPPVADDDTGTVAPLAPTGGGPTPPTVDAPNYTRDESEGSQDE